MGFTLYSMFHGLYIAREPHVPFARFCFISLRVECLCSQHLRKTVEVLRDDSLLEQSLLRINIQLVFGPHFTHIAHKILYANIDKCNW